MLNARVNMAGLHDAQRRIERLGTAMDFTQRGLGLLVGTKMKQLTMENFERQADPVTGTPWQAVGGLRALTKRAGGRILEGNPASGIKGSINGAVPQVTPRTVSIGTNKEYARIHQLGGVVKAKPGKSLAMPLTPEAARAGSARRFREQRPDSFLYVPKKDRRLASNSTNGTAFIAEPVGKKGSKVKLHFLLKKQIRMPRRPFLGWSKAGRTLVSNVMAAQLMKGGA